MNPNLNIQFSCVPQVRAKWKEVLVRCCQVVLVHSFQNLCQQPMPWFGDQCPSLILVRKGPECRWAFCVGLSTRGLPERQAGEARGPTRLAMFAMASSFLGFCRNL